MNGSVGVWESQQETSPTLRRIMYCPKCGSKNQDEIRYCTHCGANLSIVSEAMSGKLVSGSAIDERRVALLKDYFSGRRASILGAVFLLVGLALLAPLMTSRRIDELPLLALLVVGWLIYGAICLVWGISHWMDSSSEMKALEIAMPHTIQKADRIEISDAPAEQAITLAKNYSTDPISAPASVTENTTRRLEDQTAENEEVKR